MENFDRYKTLKKLRDSGLTLKACGEAIGVSSTRAGQMLKKLARHEELNATQAENQKKSNVEIDLFDLLSCRTRNILQEAGIDTVEKIRSGYFDGSLLKIRDFGRRSNIEVRDLLGAKKKNLSDVSGVCLPASIQLESCLVTALNKNGQMYFVFENQNQNQGQCVVGFDEIKKLASFASGVEKQSNFLLKN